VAGRPRFSSNSTFWAKTSSHWSSEVQNHSSYDLQISGLNMVYARWLYISQKLQTANTLLPNLRLSLLFGFLWRNRHLRPGPLVIDLRMSRFQGSFALLPQSTYFQAWAWSRVKEWRVTLGVHLAVFLPASSFVPFRFARALLHSLPHQLGLKTTLLFYLRKLLIISWNLAFRYRILTWRVQEEANTGAMKNFIL
jgi:hypothetical protein